MVEMLEESQGCSARPDMLQRRWAAYCPSPPPFPAVQLSTYHTDRNPNRSRLLLITCPNSSPWDMHTKRLLRADHSRMQWLASDSIGVREGGDGGSLTSSSPCCHAARGWPRHGPLKRRRLPTSAVRACERWLAHDCRLKLSVEALFTRWPPCFSLSPPSNPPHFKSPSNLRRGGCGFKNCRRLA